MSLQLGSPVQSVTVWSPYNLSFLSFQFSDQVKLNDKLMEERDQLQIVVDELREKLDEAFVTQQEVETQRDAALDDVSQVESGAHATPMRHPEETSCCVDIDAKGKKSA